MADETDETRGRHARHDEDPRDLGIPRTAAEPALEAVPGPEPEPEVEPEAPAARKPTIETRRPVDLYHEGRHIRERIREQAAEVTSEIPPITAPIRESARETRETPQVPQTHRAAQAPQTPRASAEPRAARASVPPLVPAAPPPEQAREREVSGPRDPLAQPHAGAHAVARDTPGPETDSNAVSEPHPHERVDDQPGRRRLLEAFWPPRVSRAQLVGAVLLFALGAGLAIQVRSNTASDPLRGARQEDLVRVLDELGERTRRLEDEKHRLENSRTQLQNSNDRVQEAREQNAAKADALGVLAGTVKASGPGITLTITDPQRTVSGDVLLDTLQELRAAGAEVIQINDVRVVAGTWFNGTPPGDIVIDGTKVLPPYVFKVIGNPQDLQPALNIPGGVVKTLEKKQAGAIVTPSQEVLIDALRPANKPGYARSAPGAGNG